MKYDVARCGQRTSTDGKIENVLEVISEDGKGTGKLVIVTTDSIHAFGYGQFYTVELTTESGESWNG